MLQSGLSQDFET